MGKNNINKFMALSSIHIADLNRSLKNIKSDVIVDYIQLELIGITIVTNKVALSLNLQVIENYVKNVENVNLEYIEAPRLPQLKFYVKIIGIPYFIENTNISIMLDFIESIIKSNHIFNNLSLVSKPQVIKALSKSDIAIIQVDIVII